MAFDGHYGDPKRVFSGATEAEFLALSYTAKELIWWQRFFEAFRFDTQHPVSIYCDNLQTIRLLTKETLRLQTKLEHIDKHQCWLRQEVQADRLKIQWIAIAQMMADGFTKELPR